jgi:hypothetical protein
MDRAPEPLTLEEHRQLARELRLTSARLHELCSLVVSLYGSESRAAFTFSRAAESVDRLRHEMQTQAAVDWPEAVHEHIYG